MTTKKVFEDKDKRVYEKTDDTPIIGTGSKTYTAEAKGENSEAKGKSVEEAVKNLSAGQSTGSKRK